MKRILIRSGKSPFRVATPEEFIHQDLIGTNSGNLLFSDAAHKLLLTDGTEVTSNGIRTDCSAERARQINEEYDTFVVPLANAFRPSFRASLDRLSTLIEQLTIPVVVMGVGAQVGEDYDTERLRPMEDSVKRFAAAVLDRSASIGVRGELTADYLKGLGFADVDIIGCPSMFLYGETFPEPRRPAPFTDRSRIAINLSPDAMPVGDITGMARLAQERFPELMYYAQNLRDAETLFWGDTSEAAGSHEDFPHRLTHPLLRADRVRVPLDPATWIEELRSYDFAYGTRIHGNIAALLAGTPAVVLVHDSRTLELCRYFGIPHRMLSGLGTDIRPEELYEQADFSG
ncbi:polysaccharide pyruvyl transferase family protein, partial [Streptomyces sp. NPDC048845]